MTVYSIVAIINQSCNCTPATVIPVTIIGGDVLIAAMLNPCLNVVVMTQNYSPVLPSRKMYAIPPQTPINAPTGVA